MRKKILNSPENMLFVNIKNLKKDEVTVLHKTFDGSLRKIKCVLLAYNMRLQRKTFDVRNN